MPARAGLGFVSILAWDELQSGLMYGVVVGNISYSASNTLQRSI